MANLYEQLDTLPEALDRFIRWLAPYLEGIRSTSSTD